jgi:hypothetical protein
MNARTRNVRSTYSTRVQPHTRRRNGIIDAPREHSTVATPHVALAYGWRAFG